jgi:2-polyprenyl-6-methoxyphenol hydroxylase-like FAD-dependent oxidoreductase
VTAPPAQADVAIVGAGTAGLAFALAAARAGLSVVICEKQPAPPAPVRGEIIQPNGLMALEALGALEAVRARPHAEVLRYHFRRIGHGALVTFDYSDLSVRHAITWVLLPESIQGALVEALGAFPNATLCTDAAVTRLIREDGAVRGLAFRRGEETHEVRARLVVGADGPASRVRRELAIGALATPYPEGYLTGLLPRGDFGDDAFYYLGKREILGLLPVAKDTVYFFYMAASEAVPALRRRGTTWLRERIAAIHPPSAEAAGVLESWRDLGFHPCTRVMASRWYAPGVALLGDAARSVNPHVAQGRNLALVDAVALAERVVPDLVDGRTPSPAALHAYERARRPQAEALQRLGDELVLFWNAGHPVLTGLRDRGFSGMSRRPRARARVTALIAGLSDTPLGPGERLGLLLL